MPIERIDKVAECRGDQAVINNKTVSTLLCMALIFLGGGVLTSV